jgi:hypothetical protein
MVSMSYVQGGIGSYNAGNLFLFPWLKPSGVAPGANQVREPSLPGTQQE